MAKIDVQSAFVEDVLSGDNGVWALKTAEPHSRKNDRDEWVTTSRTFRILRAGKDSGVELGKFRKGDRISFSGAEKTDVREHQGKKYYDLLVWADTVVLAEGQGGGQGHAGQPQTASGGDWTPAPTGGAQNASWDTADTTTPF